MKYGSWSMECEVWSIIVGLTRYELHFRPSKKNMKYIIINIYMIFLEYEIYSMNYKVFSSCIGKPRPCRNLINTVAMITNKIVFL